LLHKKEDGGIGRAAFAVTGRSAFGLSATDAQKAAAGDASSVRLNRRDSESLGENAAYRRIIQSA
jgi:hypothetical protein